MKALVAYDSTWGNTEKIAHAIAAGIGSGTKAIRVGTDGAAGFEKIDLLVLGSPVLGGRPSEAMQRYIKGIPDSTARKLKVATFDTRLIRKFAKIFGYAAIRMADQLKERGCNLLATDGFFVKGRSGPLATGELERAAEWGSTLSHC